MSCELAVQPSRRALHADSNNGGAWLAPPSKSVATVRASLRLLWDVGCLDGREDLVKAGGRGGGRGGID